MEAEMDIAEDTAPPVHEDKKRRLEAGTTETSQVSGLAEGEDEESSASRLPLSRVKEIVKTATGAKISKDTLRLLSLATELFLEDLARKAFNNAAAMRKKTITTNDLLDVCNRHSQLHFLPDSKVLKAATPHKKAVRTEDTMETES